MNDLFKKLNLLIRSSLNEALGAELPLAELRRRLTPDRLGPDIDHEVMALRQRINEALDYETQLQAKVDALQSEVARWDQQADEAVMAGNDAAARHAIVQMRRAQERLALARADLDDHQRVAAELIDRVNLLEAVAAEAKLAQEQTAAGEAGEPAEQETQRPPLNVPPLAEVLRGAHEKIGQMGDLLATQNEIAAASTKPPAPSEDAAADDDLAARRQRLSKPGS